jgi:hypothetical protein
VIFLQKSFSFQFLSSKNMKKVLFSLVATCAIIPSFAQSPTFNEVTLNQSGNRQEAYLTQIGANNQARVAQSNGGGSGYNLVNASQIGGSLTGERHVLIADQAGSYNQTSISQRGANTRAEVYQSGTENIFSAGQYGANRTSVSVTAYQMGNSNRAYVDQSTSINSAAGPSAFLIQTGNNNLERLTQTGAGHTSYLRQEGNANVIQGLEGTGSAALQSGVGNNLRITQTQTLNTASVSQIGNGNVGTIFQSIGR